MNTEFSVFQEFKKVICLVFKEIKLQEKNNDEILSRYFVTNAPYTTIFGETAASSFLIVDEYRKIRIEACILSTDNDNDEDFPYMLLNGIYAYPEKEIIFVVDGGGYKPGARKWLEKNIKDNWLDFKKTGKDIKLMTIVEFINWFNHEFKK